MKHMDNKQFSTLLALCQKLIQAKSYSGEEKEAVAVLEAFFKESQVDEVWVDTYGSIVGSVQGREDGPTLLLDGHIDTVPVGNEGDWAHPPFEGRVEEGRLYGRGASDMKASLAAMAVAMANFTEKHGRNFKGKICVAGVVQEECFEGVAARSISAKTRPDVVIIGEASELNLKIGQRGRAEIKLEVFGKPAHSANPQMGINAVYKMCGLIEAVRKLPPPQHKKLGPGILELTDIHSSPYPGMSVVPEYCVATFDRRLLAGETPEEVMAPLQALLDREMAKDPELKAKVGYTLAQGPCYTGQKIGGERFFPGWVFDESEGFVQTIKTRLEALGQTPRVEYYNFCTNGSHYAGEAGICTLGFGPSRENLAHTVDEYIELDQLKTACEGYGGIMEALLL